MRHAARLSRALSLLLAVTALLPAALLAQAPACGSQGAGSVPARSCCCEPSVPACDAAASLRSMHCGCSSDPAPVAPDRSLAPSPDVAGLAALPPASLFPTSAMATAAARPLAPEGHRAAGCELLRLHCVILI